MEKYGSFKICPKCGHDIIRTEYKQGTRVMECERIGVRVLEQERFIDGTEHLLRTCDRCGFATREATCDAK